MSDKTPNQKIINDTLTNLLNSDDNISNFNMFAIDLLAKNLAKIDWTERQFELRDGGRPYWFFIKGGTALRLIFNHLKQVNLMPNPSDWDTQIVINPEYDFDTWYQAYHKIEEAVNQTLVMANMMFTLLPNLAQTLQQTLSDKCNSLELIAGQWNGEVRYRNSADRKTAYVYEVFHPLQPSDTARRRFAHLTPEQWADSGQDSSLFDELFPRETVEFNQLEYRTLIYWTEAYKAFKQFITETKWGFAPQDIEKIDQEFNFFRWSLERITDLNADEARFWLNKLFAKELPDLSTPKQIQAEFSKAYDELQKKPVLLGSGQRTLIIDEFYLFRLVVRYKYNKPAVFAVGKNAESYREAWSSSGNLRGELIDVTVPRRDTYEAQHHGKMLREKHWAVEELMTKVSKPSDEQASLSVSLPVLSGSYQISEQILIIREILAGESSSPTKIEKRLARGFALASQGVVSDVGRASARVVVINLMREKFEATYSGFANVSINDGILECTEKLRKWAEDDVGIAAVVTDTLKKMFDAQCLESALDLNKTGLSDVQLDGLKTFVTDASNVSNYRNVWGAGQTNAGMLDVFFIVTIYAQLASQIQTTLQRLQLDLSIKSPRRSTDAREVIKAFCRQLVDEPNLYPQVSGRAASYYQLKELDEVFEDAKSKILVNSIDIRTIYFYKADILELPFFAVEAKIKNTLTAIGALLVAGRRISKFRVQRSAEPLYSLDIQIQPQGRVQTYMRVALDYQRWWKYAEYQTEYAFGLPVVKLSKLIQDLKYQVGASEFSQSQRVKGELKMLQQALSIREFSHHSGESSLPPPFKRNLSSGNLAS